MKRDPIEDPADYGDGVTYIECLLLQRLNARDRALAIARALITPCLAGADGLDDTEQLRFWSNLIAHLLGQAEASIGADGREVIVQTMRNVPASTALLQQH